MAWVCLYQCLELTAHVYCCPSPTVCFLKGLYLLWGCLFLKFSLNSSIAFITCTFILVVHKDCFNSNLHEFVGASENSKLLFFHQLIGFRNTSFGTSRRSWMYAITTFSTYLESYRTWYNSWSWATLNKFPVNYILLRTKIAAAFLQWQCEIR